MFYMGCTYNQFNQSQKKVLQVLRTRGSIIFYNIYLAWAGRILFFNHLQTPYYYMYELSSP